MKKIYFAHPYSYYNTVDEREAILNIKDYFGDGWEIINPGSKEIQYAFNKYKEEHPDNYMQFFAEVVSRCDAIICMPFKSGEIGAGVQYEAEVVDKNNGYIYLITDLRDITLATYALIKGLSVSVEKTRELLTYDFGQRIKEYLKGEISREDEIPHDPDARSWMNQDGIIVTINEAKRIIQIIDKLTRP